MRSPKYLLLPCPSTFSKMNSALQNSSFCFVVVKGNKNFNANVLTSKHSNLFFDVIVFPVTARNKDPGLVYFTFDSSFHIRNNYMYIIIKHLHYLLFLMRILVKDGVAAPWKLPGLS